MLGWLYRMLIGRFSMCEHQWEILEKVYVDNSNGDGSRYYRYHIRCTKCGDISTRNTN